MSIQRRDWLYDFHCIRFPPFYLHRASPLTFLHVFELKWKEHLRSLRENLFLFRITFASSLSLFHLVMKFGDINPLISRNVDKKRMHENELELNIRTLKMSTTIQSKKFFAQIKICSWETTFSLFYLICIEKNNLSSSIFS